jgi:hypothetical protein
MGHTEQKMDLQHSLALYFIYLLKKHMFTDRKYVCLKYSTNKT